MGCWYGNFTSGHIFKNFHITFSARYGRKSIRPDRMQATETVCDDDFTDKSDSESDSEDDYSESEVDEEGNLRDFISDDIEYTDYSSTEEQKLIEAFTQPILAAIKPNLIIHFCHITIHIALA
tara:strand:+ start:1386 stop:1754 length:369 start_codon:yes stop_codon:yes gene_type:complete